tara:strand:- start:315 stop:494 length:180 start_codon:yes stop_codon:yes gene_type:complete
VKVDYEIDTVQVLTEEIRKALSDYNDPAVIAVKLALIQKSVSGGTRIEKLFNKFSATDE